MLVEVIIEAPMKQVSDTMFVGTTNIGDSTETVEFKYNSENKRGYIKTGNRWKCIKPHMKPVAVGSIIVKQAWPGKRVFTVVADTEEVENPEGYCW